MNRFNIFKLAVVLGLATSLAFTYAKLENPVDSSVLQSDFVNNSNQLAMPWDTATLAANGASCKVYLDLTLFNLTPIRGPYYIEL